MTPLRETNQQSRVGPGLPGEHEVGAGVVGPWPRGTPLDGVDLFAVGLQVMDARVLLHTPDLSHTHMETHTHTHTHGR